MAKPNKISSSSKIRHTKTSLLTQEGELDARFSDWGREMGIQARVTIDMQSKPQRRLQIKIDPDLCRTEVIEALKDFMNYLQTEPYFDEKPEEINQDG